MAKSKTKRAGNGQEGGPVEGRTAQISVKLAPPATGYEQQHVDVQLDAYQARVMKRLCDAHRGEQLRGGRLVQNPVDVVRLLLEKIGRAGGVE